MEPRMKSPMFEQQDKQIRETKETKGNPTVTQQIKDQKIVAGDFIFVQFSPDPQSKQVCKGIRLDEDNRIQGSIFKKDSDGNITRIRANGGSYYDAASFVNVVKLTPGMKLDIATSSGERIGGCTLVEQYTSFSLSHFFHEMLTVKKDGKLYEIAVEDMASLSKTKLNVK